MTPHPPSPASTSTTLPPREPQPEVFLQLDKSRGAPYSRSEYFRKALWRLVQPTLFRVARPRWRVRVLRLFGGDIHPTAHIRGTVRIHHPWLLRMYEYSSLGDHVDVYNLGPIVIGRHTTISQGAHLCAGSHDYMSPGMPLLRPPIIIGSGTWICSEAFIGPDVRVGHNCVVGARAVVTKDIPDGVIVGGNPARVIRERPTPGVSKHAESA